MSASRRAKGVLAVLILLPVLAAAGVGFASPGVVRCYLVRWSSMDPVAPSLYVDPGMPESQRQALRAMVSASRERVAGLYGKCTANPVIIAGHTMEVMQAYGGNAYNRAGRTYATPVATFVILGPDGFLSADVLAHELGHAELAARVGYRAWKKVPNWFDEGLALQLDGRYTDAEWRVRTDNGRLAPVLSQMGTIRHDDWLGYATAKHCVGRWLDAVGRDGLLALLEALRRGRTFAGAFEA